MSRMSGCAHFDVSSTAAAGSALNAAAEAKKHRLQVSLVMNSRSIMMLYINAVATSSRCAADAVSDASMCNMEALSTGCKPLQASNQIKISFF
jgi:hypothetical protein